MEYLIIGNGIAGISAAETVRRLDPAGAITLVGDETFLPYSRPMISMVLEGSIRHDRLPIRDSDFYDQFRIEPVLGKRITSIDVSNKTVSTQDDRTVPFDRLLIATGADPRPIRAENRHLKNIFFMRTQEHVRGMLRAVPGARQALVLGGGLVGFKAAYGLLRRGIQVTMLIRSGYPLSLQVDERAGRMIQDELVERGLEVRVETDVAGFDGNGKVERARLTDGSELSCDLVVIGKGVTPALAFVPRNQIQVDLGILVDQHLQTTAPDIYAAGDVAESWDIARKSRWVNAIWPEAVAQGRIAGMNMAGRRVAYQGSLSRNVIRIFGLDVMTAGIVNPPADARYETLTAADRHRQTYRKLVFCEDRLVGMTLVNAIEQGGILVALMQAETPVKIAKERLLASYFNYRQLLM
jgi:nitrite reductase (NADH) large subunit